MSTAAENSLDTSLGGLSSLENERGGRARPAVVSLGGIIKSVDRQEEEAARLARAQGEEKERAAAEKEQADREAAQKERAEREAVDRDNDSDRLAHAINAVSAAEFQAGRMVTSRKGAWTIVQIKALLDALHADAEPFVYLQFFAGRSSLPMAAIEKGLGTSVKSGQAPAAQSQT